MFSWQMLLAGLLAGFCLLLALRRKKMVWTVVIAGDADDGCFFDYASCSSEQEARTIGFKPSAPVFIRRPDGTEYQLTFLPFSHVTATKLQVAISSEAAVYEDMVSDMERHIRDCLRCHNEFFQKVRAVRAMRSGGLPLLNLSPENNRWNKTALGLPGSDKEPPAA